MNAETDILEEQVSSAAPPTGPGHRLRMAREAAKLSLGEVATQLNLTVTVVSALEHGTQQNLPPPVFVRGYIKNYARLLGLAANDLVALYDSQRPSDEPVELRPRVSLSAPGRRGPSLRSVVTGVVLLGSAVGVLWWLGGSEFGADAQRDGGLLERLLGSDTPGEIARPAAAPEPQPLPTLSPVVTPPADTMGPVATRAATPTIPAASQVSVTVAPPGSDTVAPTASPEVTEPVAEVVEKALPPGMHRLRLTVRGDAWIEIADSLGERLVFDLLTAGTVREVTGMAPYDVLLGRSETVRVEIDGRPVDHEPYQRKGIARFVLDMDGDEVATRAP